MTRLQRITLPSSTPLTQTYAAGQVASISYQRGTGTPDDLVYGYDGSGARTSVAGSYARTGLPGTTTASAVYDLANELTSWNGGAVGRMRTRTSPPRAATPTPTTPGTSSRP